MHQEIMYLSIHSLAKYKKTHFLNKKLISHKDVLLLSLIIEILYIL